MRKLFIFKVPAILFCLCFSVLVFPVEDNKLAPIPIIDFDGTTPYDDFVYSGPDGVRVDYEVILNVKGLRYIKQEKTSRKLRWCLKFGEYFGWGVDLRDGNVGFDTRGAKYLTFWVIGQKGDERFQIKMKDITGTERSLKSNFYRKDLKEWVFFKIPLKDFGSTIDLSRLENVNLGFNNRISGRSGCIYIDDFKFEF